MVKFKSNEEVYLTGSSHMIVRAIYTENEKFYAKWYGEYIEVIQKSGHWSTVERY